VKFYASTIYQECKTGHQVCGDAADCIRTSTSTVMILCDGVGSGCYANIAALMCLGRLSELCSSSLSFKEACSLVASSMHRARSENIPFAAFSAVKLFQDGHFKAYTYESPTPIIIRKNGKATNLKAERFITAGYEVLGEYYGMLEIGDRFLMFSDGVSQAGLGNEYLFGIDSKGVADYITEIHDAPPMTLLKKIANMTKEISGGRTQDDTTLAMLQCREANQLTIATGPPQGRTRDREYVNRFMNNPGVHVVCGSTTADIVARELGKELQYLAPSTTFGAPPEYKIDGIEMTTEGAMMLNQVYNILDEPVEFLSDSSPVERLAKYIHRADVITIIHGSAVNKAHEDLIFKQIGVRPRQTTVNLLEKKLEAMGKLVIMVQF
jgi:hypothetical protein